jgi:hypothetical protein
LLFTPAIPALEDEGNEGIRDLSDSFFARDPESGDPESGNGEY